ncbi:MAG: response regulator [Geminicoccaceae bacterium]
MPARQAQPARALGPGRPLILVESSPAARGFFQRVLTARGFTVRTFAESHEAARAVGELQLGHAVVRLGLRDGHGLPLIRKLRAANPAMRIVAVTDVDSFASAILALRAGADDYLATPIDAGQLVASLTGRTPLRPRPADAARGRPRLLGVRHAHLRAVRPQRHPRRAAAGDASALPAALPRQAGPAAQGRARGGRLMLVWPKSSGRPVAEFQPS